MTVEPDQLDARNDSTGVLTDDINVNLILTHGGFLEEISVSIVDDGVKKCISSSIRPQVHRQGQT